MKKIDCIFYIVDDYLLLYNLKKNKFSKYRFENYIYNGRIIKQNIIIKKLNTILKEENLIKLFTVQNTIIIYGPHLKYIDKKIIIETFEQCGFKNIKLKNTKELLNKHKNYIEINNNYLIVYNENKYTIINFNKYINLKLVLKLIIKNVNDDIYVLGINNEIPDIVKFSNKLFYLENSNEFYINKIIEQIKRN